VNTQIDNPLERARHWLEQDPDPETANELSGLIERAEAGNQESQALLEQKFSTRLSFGTAGIRGPLGSGPAAMNRIVVSQTTAGLAAFLIGHRHAPAQSLRVVVGYDARKNSAVFARDTAEVLSGYGIEVLLTPHEVPTPIVAFAVRHLGCDAGVMITASHNPPEDNGYKVYFGGADEGSQIVPPVDSGIEAEIITVAKTLSFELIPRSDALVSETPADLVATYISHTIAAVAPAGAVAAVPTVVYTPMHGVGGETFLAILDAAGLQAPVLVDEQFTPDPRFPTVAFPNPEEKGALDLAFARAREVNADLIIAHDPDADRLAVALPDSSSPSGYTSLTGNQVGAILGWRAAEIAQKAGNKGALANSIVSSPWLGKIAQHFGLTHHETLTGFKYVSRVPELIFGFEEALGYLVDPAVVRDKDGISAALAIIDLANRMASEGKTLWDYLTTIEETVGAFASGQITIKIDPAKADTPITDLLRAKQPAKMGEHAVVTADDFMEGVGGFPQDNILRYYLADGSRVIVRPSGTEPKIKVYLDTAGSTRAHAEAALSSLEKAVRNLLDSLS
jgi:phosphomannomutase